MIKILRVTAASLDTRKLTLFTESGETFILKQGDDRIPDIIAKVQAAVAMKTVAEITIESTNDFAKLEQKSGGLFKFFRVAREKLLGYFAAEPNEIPPAPATPPMPKVELPAKEEDPEPCITAASSMEAPVVSNEKLNAAVADIMKHAMPASHPEFTHEGLNNKSNDTIIAVVDGKIVEDLHEVAAHVAYNSKQESYAGFQKFLERCSKVNRRHSVQDLLRFIGRGDLPIADDGSIIIYKLLNKIADKPGYYVDCHSGNVIQRVGSFVHMDENMVDHNRYNECSNGLHVAVRGYLGGFCGNVCVIAKVNPEDVIAVPNYDANKMRVCGYHILHELTDEQRHMLQDNRAITNTDAGQLLLGKIISGKHIGIIEKVKIGGQKGSKLTIEELSAEESATAEDVSVEIIGEEARRVTEVMPVTPEARLDAPPVDPKVVQKSTIAAKESAATSRKDLVRKLVDQCFYAETITIAAGFAQELLAVKKAAKVGWDKLGVTPDEVAGIMATLSNDEPKLKLTVAPKAPKVITKKTKLKSKAKPKAVKVPTPKVKKLVTKPEPKEKAVIKPNPVTPADKPGSSRDQAQKLYKLMYDDSTGSLTLKGNEHNVRALMALKRKCKKNWDILGIPEGHAKRIVAMMKDLE